MEQYPPAHNTRCTNKVSSNSHLPRLFPGLGTLRKKTALLSPKHSIKLPKKAPQKPPQNAPHAAQPPPKMPVDPRKIIVDQIVRDCYLKNIYHGTKAVPEARYNTHWGIREYLQYPQKPPPLDIPPSQVGSIKNRILVIATKSTGRVVLHKGKYNDAKHVYQIGRMWDMDELLGVKRVGPDLMILTIQKDYYWKLGEGPERMMKFTHHLLQMYAKVTGKYPKISGFTLEELGLAPLRQNGQPPVAQNAYPQRQASLDQARERSAPVSAAALQASLHYKSMDFTANGKLPAKPMVVMDVDRPSARSVDSFDRHGHSQMSLASDTLNNDSQSFIFVDDHHNQAPQMPTISEDKPVEAAQRSTRPRQVLDNILSSEANATNDSLVFHSEPPEKVVPMEKFVEVEALGMQPPFQPKSTFETFTPEKPKSQADFSKPKPSPYSPDLGIEEVALTDEDLQERQERKASRTRNASRDFVEEPPAVHDDGIDSSIREIEDFMNTQMNPHAQSATEGPAAQRTERTQFVPTDIGRKASQRPSTERLSSGRFSTERAPSERSLSQKVANERPPSERMLSERARSERALSERARSERALSERALNEASTEGATGELSERLARRDPKPEPEIVRPERAESKDARSSRDRARAVTAGLATGLAVGAAGTGVASAAASAGAARVHSRNGSRNGSEPMHSRHASETRVHSRHASETRGHSRTLSAVSQMSFDQASVHSSRDTLPTETGEKETDPEIEEIFEEINWDVTDDGDTFLGKLTSELNLIKRKHLNQLTNLEFGTPITKDIETSTGELTHLIEVFKKMEARFSLLAPRINAIENTSEGLQVTLINKKILYNDLKEILSKVRISNRDLQVVVGFNEFDSADLIPQVEKYLLVLDEAIGLIGSSNLSNMSALQLYQQLYLQVADTFSSNFSVYVVNALHKCVEELTADMSLLYPRNVMQGLRPLSMYLGLLCFMRSDCPEETLATNEKFNGIILGFMELLLSVRLRDMASPESKRLLRLSHTLDFSVGSRRTLRFGSRFKKPQEENEVRVVRKGDVSDPKLVLRMVQEGRELMLVVQYFIGTFFHYTLPLQYAEYVRAHAFSERLQTYDEPDLNLINYKSNPSELLQSMSAIFGRYVATFIKKLVPLEHIIPAVLVELLRMSSESVGRDQDFVAVNFLMKLSDKYKGTWLRFVAAQVDALNKLDIRSGAGVLPSVKQLNLTLLAVESTLKEVHDTEGIAAMVGESYEELTRAALDLFSREDPLLKSNAHDDKERMHRNVAVLQNVFSVTLQLEDVGGNTRAMRQKLEAVYLRVQREYLDAVLHRQFGKMVDFVKGHAGLKHKRDDKILIRAIASTHGSREVHGKVVEMRKKMDKHFRVGDVAEQDLVRRLWLQLEGDVTHLFSRFDLMTRGVEREGEHLSKSEIHRIFESVG